MRIEAKIPTDSNKYTSDLRLEKDCPGLLKILDLLLRQLLTVNTTVDGNCVFVTLGLTLLTPLRSIIVSRENFPCSLR